MTHHRDSLTEIWHEQRARHQAPIPEIARERYAPPSAIDGLSFALGLGVGAFVVIVWWTLEAIR